MASIYDLAKDTYESHGIGDEAIQDLIDKISEEASLVEQALRGLAVDALMEAQRRARAKITKSVTKPKVYTEEMQEAVTKACARFLHWPMMDGTLLGDATKTHLLKDAERYKANADGNLRNMKFLSLVAERLEDKQKVKEVFTDEELAKIMHKVSKKE